MENQSSNNKLFIAAGAALIVVLAALYIWKMKDIAPVPVGMQGADTEATTTPEFSLPSAQQSGGKTEVISNEVKSPTAPDISKAPHFAPTVSSADQTSINAQLDAQRAVIAKDDTDFQEWIAVAGLYKSAGDYAMAATVLKYTAAQWPSNPVSYNNLGDLYMNYTKDYPKAEAAYLQQIKSFAADLNAYRALFSLYTDTSYKPSATAAEDILKKAIAANPDAVDMRVLLARYYRSIGMEDAADIQYDAAIGAARAQGNNVLSSAQLEEEKAAQ